VKALYLRTDFYGHVSEGGSFSHVKGFLDGLLQLGHDYIAIASGDLPVNDPVRLHRIPYSTLFQNLPEILSIAYNGRLIRRTSRLMAREKPDFIYHRHSEFNYSSTILARRYGIPLVLEFNGSEVWIKKHWGRVYLERLCTWAEQVQLAAADVIAVVSDVIRDDLVRTGIDPGRILVNPNGVDPDEFRPDLDGSALRQELGLADRIVAGFVGTFGAWHGVEVLARAVKPTVERDRRIHFLIVGDGKLRPEVERILREDGVESSVTLTGSVPHRQVPAHLAASDILLSPHVQNADGSTFFGSPTKLFEYMAMGKAIVASSVGQISQVIHDGENGLTMQHRDHEDLAAKICLLAGNDELRRRLGAAARRDAVERYSWKENARRVINAVTALRSR
jgi:glycosyltransferase involved in cell wall biosynthesis